MLSFSFLTGSTAASLLGLIPHTIEDLGMASFARLVVCFII
jgi:hypothetical protein